MLSAAAWSPNGRNSEAAIPPGLGDIAAFLSRVGAPWPPHENSKPLASGSHASARTPQLSELTCVAGPFGLQSGVTGRTNTAAPLVVCSLRNAIWRPSG